MKLYKIKSNCTETKTVAILEIGNRALLGSYYGYISIFYINIATDFQFTHVEAIPMCNLDTLTGQKIDNFLNSKLSFLDKIKYYYNFKMFNKYFKERYEKYKITK